MDSTYELAWNGLVNPLSQASTNAIETIAFLHLPKTGGSSLISQVKKAPDWQDVYLPLSSIPIDLCACGNEGCSHADRRNAIRRLTPSSTAVKRLMVKFGHEKYSAVEWLRSQLEGNGASLDQTIVFVRPVMKRIESMFKDYWTQVGIADAFASGDVNLSPHNISAFLKYQSDAAHYRDSAGRINGVAWFKSFAENGGGIPFFLDEVFKSPEQMYDEGTSGRLTVVPTANMDNWITTYVRNASLERKRVSQPDNPEFVRKAIEDARDIISDLSLRDKAYDTVLTELLGAESFAP
jgi:hypothetical protein